MKLHLPLVASALLLDGFLAACSTQDKDYEAFQLGDLMDDVSPYKMGGEGGEGN